MGEKPEAVILAEGSYATTDAKTAHGLIRRSERYKIVGVIDSSLAGRDAGEVLDGKRRGIKIYASLEEALKDHPNVRYLIIGVATTGGVLPPGYRGTVKRALEKGISVVSGLHHFLSDDPELAAVAHSSGAEIIDVRKIFYSVRVHYTGRIREVKALKIVVAGTDSAVGKRTTAWMLADELNRRGIKTVFIGTGQTAWMQGAKYAFVLDSLINDFIPGVLENTVWRAYIEEQPKVIVIPGQGSPLHPVFPGTFEILNLLKPEVTLLQHAPARKYFDGFPEHPMPPLENFLKLLEILTGRGVYAITLNTEGLTKEEALKIREEIERKHGIPTVVPLLEGVDRIVDQILNEYPELKD